MKPTTCLCVSLGPLPLFAYVSAPLLIPDVLCNGFPLRPSHASLVSFKCSKTDMVITMSAAQRLRIPKVSSSRQILPMRGKSCPSVELFSVTYLGLHLVSNLQTNCESTSPRANIHSYYINTSEIQGDLSHVNISSHVKITRYFTRENNMLFS